MTDNAAEERVGELLEGGFSGQACDYADALADDGFDLDESAVLEVLNRMKAQGLATETGKGNWYRKGKLAKPKADGAGNAGKEIGRFERRLVFIPELADDTLILLTVREGTRAFRLRTYDEGASRSRFISVSDANNDVDELGKLFGAPFKHDIFWDDPDVKGVDNVAYWRQTLARMNKNLAISE